MTTWAAPFELRKLLVKWTRPVAGGTGEDLVVVTLHYLKLTGGSPDAAWSSADYAAQEARWDTWWSFVKAYYAPSTNLAEYRWYKSGPVWEPIGPALVNPADRITARAVPGTGAAGTGVLPPQCAITVTKQTEVRKRWGRMYLPNPVVGTTLNTDSAGRVAATIQADLLARFVTLMNGARADNRIPVVWSRAKAAYTTPKGTAISAHDATAYSITALEVDNLFDVMRSRRYRQPTSRLTTVLT